jgi:hypothetical protein
VLLRFLCYSFIPALPSQALAQHHRDEDVVEEIFSAIANLSGNCMENRASFHHAGVEATLLKALAKHEKSQSVVETGLTAVAKLVQGNIEVGTPNSDDGAGPLPQESVRGEDASLIAPQMRAIVGKIVRALVKADGSKVLARALHRHAAEHTVAALGCQALSDICVHGYNEDERRYAEALTGVTLPKSLLKTPTVEAIANRPHLSASTKAEELILVPLGQSGAPAALTAVLQIYINDLAVVQWALLALNHLAACSSNLPLLHAAGVDALLVQVLQVHFPYHSGVVNMCYSLISHFGWNDECRARIGRESGGEVLLVSLAHNMSAALPAKLGADAISALCLSPQYDAIAVIASKDSLGPSYDELDANQRTAMKAQGMDGQKGRIRATSEPSEDLASAAEDAQRSVTRSFGSLFGWQSASQKAEKPATTPTGAVPKTNVTTFELMYKKGAAAAGASSGLLGYAHGAFHISKGMTDQEEEAHTARALAKSRKSNSAILIKGGVSTILLTILDQHCKVREVQISAVNAINSLALDATHRNELNHEGIFDSMAKAYADCLRRKAPLLGSLDGSIHSLGDSDRDSMPADEVAATDAAADAVPSTPVRAAPAGLQISTDLASIGGAPVPEEVDDEFSAATRRLLLVTLNIALGTLCMPTSEEMEGITANSDASVAAANQTSLGALGFCEMITECLKAHARVSI